MICLLDTNMCIYIVKQKPATVVERFNMYTVGDIAVSSITVAELMYGAQKSQQPERNLAALEQFLLPLVIAEFDSNAAYIYGEIRAVLEQQGTPIGALDLLIAAHARSLGVTLVTNNMREFERVPGMKIENWAG